MRRPLLLAGLLALAACGRDFSLPERGVGIQGLTVTPAVAGPPPTVVAVSFQVSQGAGTPEVTILGTRLTDGAQVAAGTFTFEYTVRGDEPEGVDVAVDVAVREGGASAAVRFDFTPPALVEGGVQPVQARVGTGEALAFYLKTTETLGEPPSVTLEGGAEATCLASGDPSTTTTYLCTRLADAGVPEGWQHADVRLVDPAGNEGEVQGVLLGISVDHGGSPVVSDLVVSPARAGRGAQIAIDFRVSLPLLAAPTVTIDRRPADEVTADADEDGRWSATYALRGDEGGGPGFEATIPVLVGVTAGIDRVGSGTADLLVDFEPPRPVGLTASVPAVSAGATVELELEVHEPAVRVQVSVQGLPFVCDPLSPERWSCRFVATGLESQGPQIVAIYLTDDAGNTGTAARDAGFAFDFQCVTRPEGLRRVRGAGRGETVEADPGVFEPSALVELVAFPGDPQPWASVTADADGSLAGVSLPALYGAQKVWAEATDALGHDCAAIPAGVRLVSDLSAKSPGDDRSAGAWLLESGTPEPSPWHFAQGAELDGAGYAALSVDADGTAWSTAVAQLAEVTGWERVHQCLGGDCDPVPFDAPAVWDDLRGEVFFYQKSTTTLGSGSYTWGWDGATWSGYPTTTHPEVSRGHVAVYDPARGQVLLFGGVADAPLSPVSGTWRWRDSWLSELSLAAPRPRRHAALAYQSWSARTVLFGGTSSAIWDDTAVPLGDTWNRADEWEKQTDRVAPPARYGHAMAAHETEEKVVLFGGTTGPEAFAADTWIWQGDQWRLDLSAVSPPGRNAHAMTWDPVHRRVLLFGGRDAHGARNDLWAFDGRGWSPLEALSPPGGRYGAAMAVDPLRSRLVVIGGMPGPTSPTLREVWELDLGCRHPALLVRFDPMSNLLSPSQVAVRAVGYGTGMSGIKPAPGLRLLLWDSTARRWVETDTHVADAAAPMAARTLEANLSGADLERFSLGDGLQVLLVPLYGASPDGAAELELDSVALIVDL